MEEGPRYPGSVVVAHFKQVWQERRSQQPPSPQSALVTYAANLWKRHEGRAIFALLCFGFCKFSIDAYMDSRCEELSSRCETVEHLALKNVLSMQKLQRIKETRSFWMEHMLPVAGKRGEFWRQRHEAHAQSCSKGGFFRDRWYQSVRSSFTSSEGETAVVRDEERLELVEPSSTSCSDSPTSERAASDPASDGVEHWRFVQGVLMFKTSKLLTQWEEELQALFKLQLQYELWRRYTARAHVLGVAIKVCFSGDQRLPCLANVVISRSGDCWVLYDDAGANEQQTGSNRQCWQLVMNVFWPLGAASEDTDEEGSRGSLLPS